MQNFDLKNFFNIIKGLKIQTPGKVKSMYYKEFLDIIDSLEESKVFYFKPSEPSVMNAYHPDIKNHLFSLSMEPDGRYLFRYMVVIDGVRVKRGKLEEMFHEKKWMDYIPFDIIDDYNEWLLYHPEYCP